jgi:outer membrane protein assembly factor BamB
MLTRSVVAAGFLVAAAALCPAQPVAVSRALPPDPAVLERLNLRTEWTLHIPIEGRRDTILSVQTIGDQLFVQTRTGLFCAVDAATGKLQWSAQLGNGGYANVYPVSANAEFVVVVHVTQLYCFYRYTGVLEYLFDLGTGAVTGPVIDPENAVYAVLAVVPGAGGGHRVAAYDAPPPLKLPNTTVVDGDKAKTVPAVDLLSTRYPTSGVSRLPAGVKAEPSRASIQMTPPGGLSGTRTPSLAVTPSVSPPYVLDTEQRTPAVGSVPSLRQPYTLHWENANNVQRSPSIQTIPPSVAAALALSDLRPRGNRPTRRWEFGTTNRVLYPVLVTPRRLWGASDGKLVVAVSKYDNGKRELEAAMPAQVSAQPVAAETTGYFPADDGNLYAVDLVHGERRTGVTVLWRANVGGLMNHTPFLTDDAVFASGDNSGVTRIDRATGEIQWRTESAADRVVAATHEFLYVRDRQGRFLVYDVKRATDPGLRFSRPITGINLAEFNVPVTNTVSDRIFLAAENGLIVCLRDAGVKYRHPVRIAPEAITSAPPPKAPGQAPGDTKIDPKGDPRMDPKVEPKVVDPKPADPKAVDPKKVDPKTVDPKGGPKGDEKGADPKKP